MSSLVALGVTGLASTTTASAQKLDLRNGLALRGHDPVAYFIEGRARRGDKAITASHGGATWRFASEENRSKFLADPARYVPQYGGHCAWAASEGYLAPSDPEAFRIVGGKLYLNYSRAIQTRWERDIAGNIMKGDANWPGLSR